MDWFLYDNGSRPERVKHKYCLSLGTCHKYVVQFTDPSPTIFWYAKKAKLIFLNMPALHTIQ